MRATEGKIGRVFVLRLEDGDIVPECIEKFALEKKIQCGHVILIGGIGGGQIVSGPRFSDIMPPDPIPAARGRRARGSGAGNYSAG